jgi:hypothetical protein|tara:strand:+ start:168 stop:437 length:270 start_codon:yes stop_codon:yes gene_type:complete
MVEGVLSKYETPLALKCEIAKDSANSLHESIEGFNPNIDIFFHNIVFGRRITIQSVNQRTQKKKPIDVKKKKNKSKQTKTSKRTINNKV